MEFHFNIEEDSNSDASVKNVRKRKHTSRKSGARASRNEQQIRAKHNDSERIRRHELKKLLFKLRDILPAFKENAANKQASKSQILKAATVYIWNLEQRCREKDNELENLVIENHRLQTELDGQKKLHFNENKETSSNCSSSIKNKRKSFGPSGLSSIKTATSSSSLSCSEPVNHSSQLEMIKKKNKSSSCNYSRRVVSIPSSVRNTESVNFSSSSSSIETINSSVSSDSGAIHFSSGSCNTGVNLSSGLSSAEEVKLYSGLSSTGALNFSSGSNSSEVGNIFSDSSKRETVNFYPGTSSTEAFNFYSGSISTGTVNFSSGSSSAGTFNDSSIISSRNDNGSSCLPFINDEKKMKLFSSLPIMNNGPSYSNTARIDNVDSSLNNVMKVDDERIPSALGNENIYVGSLEEELGFPVLNSESINYSLLDSLGMSDFFPKPNSNVKLGSNTYLNSSRVSSDDDIDSSEIEILNGIHQHNNFQRTEESSSLPLFYNTFVNAESSDLS